MDINPPKTPSFYMLDHVCTPFRVGVFLNMTFASNSMPGTAACFPLSLLCADFPSLPTSRLCSNFAAYSTIHMVTFCVSRTCCPTSPPTRPSWPLACSFTRDPPRGKGREVGGGYASFARSLIDSSLIASQNHCTIPKTLTAPFCLCIDLIVMFRIGCIGDTSHRRWSTYYVLASELFARKSTERMREIGTT